MNAEMDYYSLRAALEWQVEMGATEAIGDAPIDRRAPVSAPDAAAKPAPVARPRAAPPPVPEPASADQPVADARVAAAQARDLDTLRDAMAAYPHCELQKGARSLVFGDGDAKARVMIIGEAPGRDEDREGRPFVGRAGQLLDRMFGAIQMGRTHPDPGQAIYITNVLPWRPPQNRDPRPDEIAMMMPFLERHVALVDPDLIVLMGNISCQAVLGRKGITRLRGNWTEALDRPVLPMFHPAFLLRQPAQKRAAWEDLLSLQAKLRGLS